MTCDPFLAFFFFQAEDGIRDYKVTGVQTCALPICPEAGSAVRGRHGESGQGCEIQILRERSEERRVGKECRTQGSRDASRKKKDEKQREGSTEQPGRREEDASSTAQAQGRTISTAT